MTTSIWAYIIIGGVVYILYAVGVYVLHDAVESKARVMTQEEQERLREEFLKKYPSAKEYKGKEHTWEPTFNLKHEGVKLFNIPFEPDNQEVFYIENEYDEAANRYVQQNLDNITERLADKGFSFVYLPNLTVPSQMMLSTIAYRNPQGMPVDTESILAPTGLPSNFLLDYMVHPENRHRIRSSFAWCDKYWDLLQGENAKRWYQFDYISFDGEEALLNHEALFAEILEEIGETRIFKQGEYHIEPVEDDGTADQFFNDEMKKILEDIQSQLDAIRLKGISEAVIAKYIQPRPTLSHIRITKDFRIFLDDYNGMEIKMEPLIKAVYILFLRHNEGILFKDLSDYRVELEYIYRAIKKKNNDVDQMLQEKLLPPQISENIKKITNPLDNSINEKCTRIKETFISHFHDSIARHYYIKGGRTREKYIDLPHNLIIWEIES